jgi:hypothetical protein
LLPDSVQTEKNPDDEQQEDREGLEEEHACRAVHAAVRDVIG